jgi:hypothetical protein
MVSKRAELFERERFAKREVEVFREAVVGEIATLERGTSFEGKDRPEVGLGESIQEPRQAVVALENILTDALVVTCGEAVREERYVSLGYHLGAPHGQQFFGRNIQLEASLGYVGSFARKGWVEGMVGSGKGVLERLQFRGCGDAEEFEQIAQSTADQADVQSSRVVEEFAHVDIRMAHPESLCDFGDASAAFRVPQAIDDGPFEIADFGVLLFRDPMLGGAKDVFGLEGQKTKLSSAEGLAQESLGARDEYRELRLRDHTVNFHRGCVGQEVGVSRFWVLGHLPPSSFWSPNQTSGQKT